jgi:hypothetical protein
MRYIKTYEALGKKSIKYLFKVDDYVKKFNELETEKDESFYKIISRRKKAQGLLDDTNEYIIRCFYKKNKKENKVWINERWLRSLTIEEQEELDVYLNSKKFNI